MVSRPTRCKIAQRGASLRLTHCEIGQSKLSKLAVLIETIQPQFTHKLGVRNARPFAALGPQRQHSDNHTGEHMRRMYLLSAMIAGSLLAGSTAAQAASSCEAMLTNFDAQLSAKGIPQTDQRIAQERSQAQQACMTGNMTAAQMSLNRAAANVGLPWSLGKASSGNSGPSEAQGANSMAGQSGASQQPGEAPAAQNGGFNGTQNAGANGLQNSSGTQNTSNNTTATGSGNNQAAKTSNSGTTNGGNTRTQSANASSADQNSNGSGSKKSSSNQSGTQ